MTRILNHIRNLGYRNELTSFSLFLVSAAIIWFIGATIKIGHHAPLARPHSRLILIALLLTALVLKITRNNRQKKSLSPQPLTSRAFLTVLTTVKNHFSASTNNKIKLSALPWYLLIGPTKGGKTTLLENSQIPFLPKQNIAQESLDEINANGNCNFRATPEAVLLDIPSSYMTSRETLPVWQTLFNKKRSRNTVAGVIVALPLSDLTDPAGRLQFINNLKLRITELKENFGASLPFYFAVTKCDLLPGFLDFFAHSGIDELGQAWGITLPMLPAHASLIDVFSNRFNALIKRLNKQLIWRLHQERGTFERVFIKDFPLQIERLKETLIDLLSALTSAQNRFSLRGVYLTSANQHPPEENIIQHQPLSADETSGQNLQIMHTPSMPSRSYFIRQFLLQGLQGLDNRPGKTGLKQPVVYGLCASVITLTVAFLGYDIFYSKQKLIAMRGAEVTTFNIVVPQDVPKETKVGDSLTIIS